MTTGGRIRPSIGSPGVRRENTADSRPDPGVDPGVDVWVATLPVGHADGLPREAAKGGHVRIKGSLHPIVASVSASHSIVEIGAERRVETGDEATFFDWVEGSRPEDLDAACRTSVYDLTMHLNPLLPRRVI